MVIHAAVTGLNDFTIFIVVVLMHIFGSVPVSALYNYTDSTGYYRTK